MPCLLKQEVVLTILYVDLSVTVMWVCCVLTGGTVPVFLLCRSLITLVLVLCLGSTVGGSQVKLYTVGGKALQQKQLVRFLGAAAMLHFTMSEAILWLRGGRCFSSLHRGMRVSCTG